MSEDTEQKEYLYFRAVCSILPLVSEERVIEVLHDLKNEADRTPLMPTTRRVSNFGLSLSTLGGVALGILFLDEIYNALKAIRIAGVPVGNVGVYPLILLGLVVLAFVSKFVMTQIQNMNEGVSPLGRGERPLLTGFIEFVFGVLFLAMLGSLLAQIDPLQFFYFISLATFIVGILLSEFGMTLNGFLSLHAELTSILQSLRGGESNQQGETETVVLREEER